MADKLILPTPLGNNVVAIKDEAQTVTKSGLFIGDSQKEPPVTANVIAVGPKVEQLKAGDKIVYREYATTELKVDEQDYLIVSEEDVLAIIGSY